MPRRTRAESDATAAALLATGRVLFARHGYAGVGLEQVASASGVTRGAVYHHYGSKRGLFTRVVEELQAEVGDAVSAAADAQDDAWAGFQAGCRTFLAATVADGTRRILLTDAPAVLGWDTWREQDARHSGHHLQEALHDLAGSGMVAVTSVPATAALLSGAMNEAALWVSRQDGIDGLEVAWTALAEMLAALRAP